MCYCVHQLVFNVISLLLDRWCKKGWGSHLIVMTHLHSELRVCNLSYKKYIQDIGYIYLYIHMHISATTLNPLTGDVSYTDHLVTMQCFAEDPPLHHRF